MPDHRIDRAKERYGVDLTPSDIIALESQISPANLFRSDYRGGVYLLRYNGVAMLAATTGRRIATFLPANLFSRNRIRASRVERSRKGARAFA